MSASDGHPHKTELGLDELRRRTRGLSQRHRTMLLLVNGKRTRAEVLTLAGQAGVGAEFFDELVAAGMVDPSSPPVVPAAARPEEARASVAVAAVAPGEWPATSSGFDSLVTGPSLGAAPSASLPAPHVPPAPPPTLPGAAQKAVAVVRAASASGAPRPRRAVPPVLTLDDAVPLAATRAVPRKTAAEVPARPSAAAKPSSSPPAAKPDGAESARVRFTSVVHKPKAPAGRRAPPVELRQEPHLTPAKPPGRTARIKMLAPAGPLDDESEMNLLAEVRSLLIGTLLVDGPVTSSLTALRVRKARNRFDLTALVWEIERTLVRAKRPREAQSRLTKARDLLGLGNTVVDEEPSPGWPRTR